jgi:putative acetyltransferase
VSDLALRPYVEADEPAALELWRRTWQAAYPAIDFSARLPWWRERWRSELVPAARIVIAETPTSLAGFVTIDRTGYLDQIVVAPESWAGGVAAALLDEAKALSPRGIDLLVNADNARAIRFYQKHGFEITGADVNPRSGASLHKMSWRASQET